MGDATRAPDRETVPEEWARLGFSGLFSVRAGFTGNETELTALEQRVPCYVPVGTNSNIIALRVDRSVSPPEVILVRQDFAAVYDVMTGGPWKAVQETAAPHTDARVERR